MKSLIKLALLSLIMSSNYALAQEPIILNDSDPATKGSQPYESVVNNYLHNKKYKVVGGKEAKKGSYPWQVSLGVSWIANPYDAHFCGGSIYTKKWIITAAHCVESLSSSQISISAGTHILSKNTIRHNIKQIIIHQDYNTSTANNDIALLEIFKPLSQTKLIRPIPLLTKSNESKILFEDAKLTVSGWGLTGEGENVVSTLRYLDNIPYIPSSFCNMPLIYDGKISENMFCAGILSGGKDSCSGDSGGSITTLDTNESILVGVVSWGIGCARPNKPGVYTRITQYEDWIIQNTLN